MLDENGTQCGFCTVGFVMSLTGFCIDTVSSPHVSKGSVQSQEPSNKQETTVDEWNISAMFASNVSASTGLPNTQTEDQKPKSNLSKNQIQQLERRIAEIESEIPKLETEVARLSAEMSRPEIAADFARLAQITEQHANAESRAKSLYDEWARTSDQIG
jgi:xanthine dehydrogenase iron-sulfur cluster and FAD-binding subunit A